MNLDLFGQEAAALTKQLDDITRNDRCPFSEGIRKLKATRAKFRAEPVREPLSPPKVYAPPRATIAGTRRAGHR
jgi:hypothetical protein